MPRSGTTLAEQILASHPAVFGAGELPFWNSAWEMYRSATRQNGACERLLGLLAQDYLRLLKTLSADAQRVIDKMPTNFWNLGLILAALPSARIIHMVRDPIDTCLSIYFQHFETGHAYAQNLDDLAHYYTEYLRIMRHWQLNLPRDAILQVPYEGLVNEPEAWIRRMLEFIDLPWDSHCIDFHLTNRTVTTASKWQVRQKINSLSVERWRNYQTFIGPLLRLPARQRYLEELSE
jgi:hypothetical protein